MCTQPHMDRHVCVCVHSLRFNSPTSKRLTSYSHSRTGRS